MIPSATHTNIENHPRLIRARDRDNKPVPKIRLDPRTGLPFVAGQQTQQGVQRHSESTEDEDVTGIFFFFDALSLRAQFFRYSERHATVARPRDESLEEKKARKQAVKAEKQTRRADKKVFQAAIFCGDQAAITDLSQQNYQNAEAMTMFTVSYVRKVLYC